MNERHIYLVRHGEINVGEEKRYIGQTDAELTPAGRFQAKQLQQALSKNHFEKIYCSRLKRTLQTAEIIAEGHGLLPVAIPEMQEINMGTWEGEKFTDIKSKYPEAFERRGKDLAHFRPSGGESFADLQERVIAAFGKMVRNSRNDILLVAHAGVNRAILAYVLGMPLSHVFRMKQDYGCLNVISFNGQTFCVEKMNVVPSFQHLTPSC